MNFDEEDKLELQHLAGGSIIKHAPVFSAQGRFLFVRCGLKVQVYVSSTGELTRELTGATEPLVSLEVELKQPEVLVGCTSSGKLLRWHWRTGVLQKTTDLQLDGGVNEWKIETCDLMNLYRDGGDTACAFVTARKKGSYQLFWFVVNTSTGLSVEVNCGLKLKLRSAKVDVGKKDFKYVVIAQGYYVYCLNYKTWDFMRYRNFSNLITVIKFSPNEELFATGDENGVVLLWRQFDRQKKMVSTQFHWHHTPVTSLAFSPSGMTFYSSGHEAVLVKWPIAKPQKQEFMPRMPSVIRHIAVSEGNEHLVVCTDDNAVQFINAGDINLRSTLQHFTYGVSDKTGKSKFPLGLCLNPRSNTLVLNGRVGHLQFYSAYTKSLLYNLRVIDRNVQTHLSEKVIYNPRITRAAFNIKWMATGEVYNDEENFVEVHLKFWLYNEKVQSYELNTDIDLPHEGGFRAIVFSNQAQVNDLRCATVGKDNVIKLWGMTQSQNIHKRGRTWICLAETSYKNFPIKSICFSQDGSLLAAGYGNTLCLYDARTLLLLRALTCPSGLDGVVAKAQLRLAKLPVNGTRKELTDQRQKLWTILKSLLTSDDKKLVEEARDLIGKAPGTQVKKESTPTEEKIKSEIFRHIMQMPELGLHQKLQLFRQFGIECSVHEKCQKQLVSHLQRTVVEASAKRLRLKSLEARLERLSCQQRFKAKHRLEQFKSRQRREEITAQELLPLFSVLQLDSQTQPATKKRKSEIKPVKAKKTKKFLPPLQSLAEISHVQFGVGAQAHLVAVCTESRVLIWNLMTLRLQAGLKLSVRQLAFDPITNLLAAITKNNELHVFQPNVPLPVYQRSNLPELHGLVWLPRRQPKQRSINVDWQAQSTLLMLTTNQEIVYLAPPGVSAADDAPAPISFNKPAETEQMQFATFGTYAIKQQKQLTEQETGEQTGGPLIVGRGKVNVVNAMVNLSAHTMPAMSLICNEFIKSLLTPAETTTRHNETLTNGNVTINGNGHYGDHSDEEMDEEDDHEKEKPSTLIVRKTLLDQNESLVNDSSIDPLVTDAKLKRITALKINLDF